MSGFALQRLARTALTLWIVVTVVFFATRLSGDPLQYILPPDTPTAQREELRVILGLNRSYLEQYVLYFSNLLRGEFGTSFYAHRPVLEMFVERIPITLQLAIPSLLLSILIGVPAGVLAALHRNSRIDRLLMTVSFLGQSVPNFVIGIVLILIFSFSLQWLPSGGTATWASFVMPIITLGAATAANIARLMRSSMLDVLGQEYMKFALSKGLPHWKVVLKHGLRNALMPVLTIVGLQIGTLIGGAVVVEVIFAWPGAGRLLVDAVLKRDFALLQLGVLVVATTVILANALVDVACAVLDPRIRDTPA